MSLFDMVLMLNLLILWKMFGLGFYFLHFILGLIRMFLIFKNFFFLKCFVLHTTKYVIKVG